MSRRTEDVTGPVRRSVAVSWNPEAAYRRFVSDFATWWPSYGHSIGGKRVKRIVFEARVGGRIFEEHHDGTRFLWGTVTVLDPPRRVSFTHHASHAEADAQEVEVSFTPEGTGTRVDLVARGWEKMSLPARRARGGYVMTWGAALDTFAGRWSGVRLLFIVMSTAIDVFGQRSSFVRHSLSRLPSQEDK